MPSADEQARSAQRRAQDQLAAILKKGRRPQRSVGVPVLQPDPPFSQGINLWMDPAGVLRGYRPDGTKMQYATTTVTANSGTFPADPQPETLVKTYAVDWGRSFCDLHGVETGSPGVWYGDDPTGAHVRRKVMLGLPDATIRTDLAGATIDTVELSASNLDGYSSTVTLHWGLHNVDAVPASYSAMRADALVDVWPKVGTGETWRPAHVAFGMWLRDNEAKGLTIDQPAGVGYAGLIDWTSVKLRIAYTV